ncbi:tRNA pseudouridine(55) synthase TruB [Planctobacterium marinum]|uniref:tRNA pseudouridine(55) synthase TruB n=1 Tax=Planctobacterium marinum TaxID=1631968 RepID=UPI001E53132A|nr:tRNA pseudouridine(55) synthase TruB [Planctobacterium marinum]MCC2605491.1 tRNA pseudouridine(55) synthase TruB [Planctobacterium marinum]
MGRRKSGRKIDGVILVDKPLGASSNQILQKVRWIFNANKAGHTGALDPLASGMLPVCFGNSTKFAQYSLDADKTYQVTAKLGIRTTTSDADGEVVSEQPVDVSKAQLDEALNLFRGDIKQVPSMFSALKHEGKPLYYYARQGITIERPARAITIYKLTLDEFTGTEVSMTVHCSKGTYIRSLVDDLGQELGCGAYVTRLHRTDVAGYSGLPMFTPEYLESLKGEDNFAALDALKLPVDAPIVHLPQVQISEADAARFLHGQPITCEQAETSDVRVYNESQFLGVAQVDNGKLQPKRLVS